MLHGTALTYFAEVARTGSLAAASENLHVAVSAVSRQIAQLERQIGTPLFERMPRGMVLTRSGEVLAEHARRTLLEARAVLSEISTSHAQSRGIVHIGCEESLTTSFLPGVMAAFHREQPLTRFIVRSGGVAAIEEWVQTGEVDLGLSCSGTDSGALECVLSAAVPIDALLRADHVLARKPSLKLDDVLAHPIAVPGRDAAVRLAFDRCCAAAGRHLEPILVTESAAVISQFVSLTDGIAVGSRVMLQGLCAQGKLVARAMDEPLLAERRLQLTTMQGRRLPAAVSRFRDALAGALRRELCEVPPGLAGQYRQVQAA